MATITSTQTGDWSVGATWVGGTAPVGTDDAVIASGHTVTKDTAKGAPDCAALTINSGGTLALSTNGLKATGTMTNNGTVTGGAGCDLELDANTGAGTGTWTITGTSGSPATITGTGGSERGYFRGSLYNANAGVHMTYVNFSTWDRVYFQYMSYTDFVRDCNFNDASIRPGLSSEIALFERCEFYNESIAVYFDERGLCARFVDCAFGVTGANTTHIGLVTDDSHGITVEVLNPNVGTGVYCVISGNGSVVRTQGYDNSPGDWRIDYNGGYAMRSVASKKTGDYGIEMVPTSTCDAETPVYIDIPIPVATGDTPQPSIYVYNATDDLDLQDAADRMVFELDPGDEWGLNESIDANTLSDIYLNWRQVSFNAADAAAGGSADKGTLILRVWLKRYIATAVVYLADMDW